jgi:hypothetical protein
MALEGTLITNLSYAVVPDVDFADRHFSVACRAALIVSAKSMLSNSESDCELRLYSSADHVTLNRYLHNGRYCSLRDAPGMIPGTLLLLKHDADLYVFHAKTGKKIAVGAAVSIERILSEQLKEACRDGT